MSAKPSLPSENIQMYLVDLLRLSQAGQPVPLAQLAAALDVSPISANQMCRKLQEEGWVTYVPYKGVSITPQGEELAARVLRRHRLWEVFLVECLHMKWAEAHETACNLEHATPDEVIERLDLFLDHPHVNPQGEPIPTPLGGSLSITHSPLTAIQVGQKVHVIRCAADPTSCNFLAEQGLRPGALVHVVAVEAHSILVKTQDTQIVLERSLAEAVWVETDEA